MRNPPVPRRRHMIKTKTKTSCHWVGPASVAAAGPPHVARQFGGALAAPASAAAAAEHPRVWRRRCFGHARGRPLAGRALVPAALPHALPAQRGEAAQAAGEGQAPDNCGGAHPRVVAHAVAVPGSNSPPCFGTQQHNTRTSGPVDAHCASTLNPILTRCFGGGGGPRPASFAPQTSSHGLCESGLQPGKMWVRRRSQPVPLPPSSPSPSLPVSDAPSHARAGHPGGRTLSTPRPSSAAQARLALCCNPSHICCVHAPAQACVPHRVEP